MTPVDSPLVETFPALRAVPGLVHGFLLRHPEIAVDTDRDTALARLARFHEETARDQLDIPRDQTWFAEQIHADHLEVCGANGEPRTWPRADGLVTGDSSVFLGIYVADCAAVYLVDPIHRALALVHSGKKGTEMSIAPKAIARMQQDFGTDPADLIIQVSPCIRPPAYEIDFASTIRTECRKAGVPASQIHDPETCTSRDLDRYYSYRTEAGRTGRHLALLGWIEDPA